MNNLNYLVNYLLKERENTDLGFANVNKKDLYRALVNIRLPEEISSEYLEKEDEYLQEELKKHKIYIDKDIKTIDKIYKNNNLKNPDRIALFKGDITKIQVDAIVNPGNSEGIGCFYPNHNCVDNQINTFAGVRLRLKCDEIMKKLNYNLKTGNTIITKGYNLPCKYVIETVGPIVNNEITKENENDLKNCYINSLKLLIDNNLKTIAFPCISTGLFKYPKKDASKLALETVDNFLTNNNKIDKVIFCLYDDSDKQIYEENILSC